MSRLIGSEIVAIGTPSEEGLDGGGLVLDYRPKGEARICRLVLAFNELGMWVEYDNATPSDADATPVAFRK